MPADHHQPAAAGLSASSSPQNKTPSSSSLSSLSSSPPPPSRGSHTPFRDDLNDEHDAPPTPAAAPWVRPSTTPSASSARRLSTPYSLHGRRHSGSATTPTDLRSQLGALVSTSVTAARNLYDHSAAVYAGLSPTQQFLALAAGVLILALSITLLIFSHRLFTLLAPIAVSWRALPGGWLIIWVLTFLVAFPPLVGYSTACTVAGFVYGFPLGWPIVASATVAGSSAAFVASRTVLSAYVDRLVGTDHRFVALGQVLRHDGLGVLALVRFCPLPYSLSNGFLATVPSIRTTGFALATALASPKLLVHVFIGSRLALLAERGDEMGFGDRLVNYLSMLIGAGVGIGVGYVIYRRTMARAEQLAREEAETGRPLDGRARGGSGGAYLDEDEEAAAAAALAAALAGAEDARLMNPDDAAALMVDDDDISLWDTAGDDGWGNEEEGGYRDEEEAVGGKNGGQR